MDMMHGSAASMLLLMYVQISSYILLIICITQQIQYNKTSQQTNTCIDNHVRGRGERGREERGERRRGERRVLKGEGV